MNCAERFARLHCEFEAGISFEKRFHDLPLVELALLQRVSYIDEDRPMRPERPHLPDLDPPHSFAKSGWFPDTHRIRTPRRTLLWSCAFLTRELFKRTSVSDRRTRLLRTGFSRYFSIAKPAQEPAL